MTPHELKLSRERLSLTQQELAFLLNTNIRTVQRWESGERIPNPVAVRVVQWMQEPGRPSDWPVVK